MLLRNPGDFEASGTADDVQAGNFACSKIQTLRVDLSCLIIDPEACPKDADG